MYGDVEMAEYLVNPIRLKKRWKHETQVAKGIIVITVQFRLGCLGLWRTGLFPRLRNVKEMRYTADGACPTNLTLRDQIEAVKWISRNISAFGGDKV